MKYLLVKDKQDRENIKKFEQKIFVIKSIQKNNNLSYLIRLKATLKLNDSLSSGSKTFLKNRCILSNRKKRLNRFINVSRLFFLSFARSGTIHGIQKAVWW